MSKPGAYLKLDGNGAWSCDPQDYSGFGLKPQTPTPKSGTTCLARARACRTSAKPRLVQRAKPTMSLARFSPWIQEWKDKRMKRINSHVAATNTTPNSAPMFNDG